LGRDEREFLLEEHVVGLDGGGGILAIELEARYQFMLAEHLLGGKQRFYEALSYHPVEQLKQEVGGKHQE
jgi:hypothetical protein